jgi:hypothetical protein
LRSRFKESFLGQGKKTRKIGLARLCPENYIVEADFCYKMLDAPTGKWKYSDVVVSVVGV